MLLALDGFGMVKITNIMNETYNSGGIQEVLSTSFLATLISQVYINASYPSPKKKQHYGPQRGDAKKDGNLQGFISVVTISTS